jgi:hypothetical protein
MRPVNWLLGRTGVAKTALVKADVQFATASRVETRALAEAQAARATATAADGKVAQIIKTDKRVQGALVPAGPLAVTTTAMGVDHQSFGEALFKPGGVANVFVPQVGLAVDGKAVVDFYGAQGAIDHAADSGRQLTPQPIN